MIFLPRTASPRSRRFAAYFFHRYTQLHLPDRCHNLLLRKPGLFHCSLSSLCDFSHYLWSCFREAGQEKRDPERGKEKISWPNKDGRRYTAKFKSQVVLEALRSQKPDAVRVPLS